MRLAYQTRNDLTMYATSGPGSHPRRTISDAFAGIWQRRIPSDPRALACLPAIICGGRTGLRALRPIAVK
jgi:hypothetical protein